MFELIDKYIDERSARGELNGRSPSVIRCVLGGFALHVAALTPNEITEADVDSWIADPTLRPATRHSMVTKLRPFVRWLAARGHIERDFTALVRAPKVPKGMARFLEAEQVVALVRATTNTRDRLIVLLMVHLGLRRIEVTRIDIEDIDMRDWLLAVRGKNHQGQQSRSLPITTEVRLAILAYLGELPTYAGPLIRTQRGTRLGELAVSNMITDLMRSVGIKSLPWDGYSGHALRHTCAQELIDAGVDIRLVQTALGHESVVTTEGYLRRKPKGLRDALEGRTYA